MKTVHMYWRTKAVDAGARGHKQWLEELIIRYTRIYMRNWETLMYKYGQSHVYLGISIHGDAQSTNSHKVGQGENLQHKELLLKFLGQCDIIVKARLHLWGENIYRGWVGRKDDQHALYTKVYACIYIRGTNKNATNLRESWRSGRRDVPCPAQWVKSGETYIYTFELSQTHKHTHTHN